MIGATDWLNETACGVYYKTGYFGASTGAAAALVAAAAKNRHRMRRCFPGRRRDLAGDALADVKLPPC